MHYYDCIANKAYRMREQIMWCADLVFRVVFCNLNTAFQYWVQLGDRTYRITCVDYTIACSTQLVGVFNVQALAVAVHWWEVRYVWQTACSVPGKTTTVTNIEVYVASLSDYCPESPKKSGCGFFQNCRITESIFNVSLNAAGGRTDGRTCLIFVSECL